MAASPERYRAGASPSSAGEWRLKESLAPAARSSRKRAENVARHKIVGNGMTGLGLAIGLSCGAPCAFAQAQPAGESANDANLVVVTGSRIPRAEEAMALPVITLDGAILTDGGSPATGDRLNALPQLRASFSQANSTRFIGTAGQNFLDLRGLGADRTLVLLDGRRQVSATPGSFRWDVNAVPADLVARVDVVSGGNSAIYGSDAVAGVVNFVLRRDFTGLSLRAQSGLSAKGDAAARFAAATFGTGFAEGRGHLTLAGEYARTAALPFTAREQGRDRRQFQLVQNTGPNLNPAAGPIRLFPEDAAGDGLPDTRLIGGLHRAASSLGGAFTAACPVAPAFGETPAAFAARRDLACSGLANPGSFNPQAQLGTVWMFQPDGTLARNDCDTDFRPYGSGNCVGGLGTSLRESGQFRPALARANLTAMAHFAVSPAFTPYLEAAYSRVTARQESSSTFGTQVLSLDNPFLTPQARGLLAQLLPPGQPFFAIDRQNLDFGARGEHHLRRQWRLGGGARGTFNGDWSYDLSAQFSEFAARYTTQGNYLRARLANAVNAVLAPAGYAGTNFSLNHAGQRVVCAVNADASGTNDDPACVPVNLFGHGAVSPAARAYFAHTSVRRQKNRQFIASGNITGTSGAAFNLPGGPIAFALGGEYRVERQFSAYDDVTVSGATFLNAVLPFDPPAYAVAEAFAELRAPLSHRLTLSAAARLSHYNQQGTGTVLAWNAGAVCGRRSATFACAPAISARCVRQRPAISTRPARRRSSTRWPTPVRCKTSTPTPTGLAIARQPACPQCKCSMQAGSLRPSRSPTAPAARPLRSTPETRTCAKNGVAAGLWGWTSRPPPCPAFACR